MIEEREDRRAHVAAKLSRLLSEHDVEIDLTLESGPLLRTGEVAVLFGVSEHCIRKWADDGKLPCIKTLGGHRLFPSKEVAEALRKATEGFARSGESAPARPVRARGSR